MTDLIPSDPPIAPAGAAQTERGPAPSPANTWVVRIGKRMRRHVDRLVERSSRVPNDPILDPALFPWTEALVANWQAIRDEALAVLGFDMDGAPALRDVSPDHGRIAADDRWRSFFIVGYGQQIPENRARCPVTAALLDRVPGLNSGFFSVLRPGAHIPPHRGVSKAMLTCHLGLVVPTSGPVTMTVGDEKTGWAEGRALVFDDTWTHEVHNRSDATRIVLLVQFERPLAQPGRLLARLFLAGVRRTSFVRDAHRNILAFHRRRDRA